MAHSFFSNFMLLKLLDFLYSTCLLFSMQYWVQYIFITKKVDAPEDPNSLNLSNLDVIFINHIEIMSSVLETNHAIIQELQVMFTSASEWGINEISVTLTMAWLSISEWKHCGWKHLVDEKSQRRMTRLAVDYSKAMVNGHSLQLC